MALAQGPAVLERGGPRSGSESCVVRMSGRGIGPCCGALFFRGVGGSVLGDGDPALGSVVWVGGSGVSPRARWVWGGVCGGRLMRFLYGVLVWCQDAFPVDAMRFRHIGALLW